MEQSFARRGALVAIVFAFALGSAASAGDARVSVTSIPDDVWSYMQGRSWHGERSCPQRSELALLRIPYHDFDGRTQIGPMIVARKVASKVAAIFQEIYDSGEFRIYRIALVDDYGGDDDRSIAANNTSGFNCRTTEGGGVSQHAFGLAVDINPVQNPYVAHGVTEPEAGKAYDAPAKRHAGMIGVIVKGDVVYKAFAKRGWGWGGEWARSKDYQHFSASGH
ncbi:cytosolic protein [Methylocystis bryophila]|uniref:Cytosolic protein n=2 Tax=Methylocystis bryophila TaxID=655015 RepID=A0A1W6N0H9_9HYPH|nr:cytosolic protein [Methylocystis bryophila]